MRVGVDGACWSNRRGYGRFARELFSAMVCASPDTEFVCFVDEAALDHVPARGPNVEIVPVYQSEAPATAAAADGSRSPLDMLRFTKSVWRETLDVFFFPSVYTYFPLPPGLPAVVTIHDAIAERFPSLTLPSRRARLFWNAKVRMAIAQSSIVLTVSEYARRDVAQIHGVPASRLRVAVESAADAYQPTEDQQAIADQAQAVGLPAGEPYFVYVGGFNPHKNVDLVVRAHARFVHERDPSPPPHLVLVGSTTDDVFFGSLQQIRDTVGEMRTGQLVHWPGFVPDEELAVLLSGAKGLFLVSEAEGFGLPAVEAAACGCPVIATTESPLPELLEGGGLFLTPGSEPAIFDSIVVFMTNEGARKEMATTALARARALSWAHAADSTMRALLDARVIGA